MTERRPLILAAVAAHLLLLSWPEAASAAPSKYTVTYSISDPCSPSCHGATMRITDMTSGNTVLATVGSPVDLMITEVAEGTGVGRIRLETVDQQLSSAVPRREVLTPGGRFEYVSGLTYHNEVSVDITAPSDVIDSTFGLAFAGDEDGDGISNIDEDDRIRYARDFHLLLIQTGQTTIAPDLAPWLHSDFDGDGYPDSDEFFRPDYDGDRIPTFADTDSDSDYGPDIDERTSYHTDPYRPDTDGDGARDGVEVRTYQTDPLDPDTDNDGISDGDEIYQGSDPLDRNDPYDFSNPCRIRTPNDTYRYLINLSSTNGVNWRLYQAFFLRQPDRPGFDYWNSEVVGAQISWAGVANLFSASDEFYRTYGTLTDNAYVSIVYENVLCRQPEPAGRRYWQTTIGSGQLTRGEMMLEFSNSQEYKNLTETN